MISSLLSLAAGITVGAISAGHFSFTRGVRIGRAVEREAAEAKREARMRQMLADIRGEKQSDAEGLAELCAILGPREVEGVE